MKIEECITGIKARVPADKGEKVKYHFRIIDSITRDMFTGEPLVIIRVLGADKMVLPEELTKVKKQRIKHV